MVEINNIKDVVKNYQKDRDLTSEVQAYLGRKIKLHTGKIGYLITRIKMAFHRFAYKVNKNYRQKFDFAAQKYLDAHRPVSMSASSAARTASSVLRRREQEEYERLRKEKIDELFELSEQVSVQEDIVNELELSSNLWDQREEYEAQLVETGFPEWNVKKKSIEWKKPINIGQEGEALEKLREIRRTLKDKMLGKMRFKKELEELKSKKQIFKQILAVNEQLPAKFQSIPTQEIRDLLIEERNKLSELLNNESRIASEIRSNFNEFYVLIPENVKRRLEEVPFEESSSSEEVENSAEEEVLDFIGNFSESSASLEPLEETISFNEHSSQFFNVMHEKCGAYAERLFRIQLQAFAKQSSHDCCTGFSEKNGVYTLTIERPLLLHLDPGDPEMPHGLILSLGKKVEFQFKESSMVFKSGYRGIVKEPMSLEVDIKKFNFSIDWMSIDLKKLMMSQTIEFTYDELEFLMREGTPLAPSQTASQFFKNMKL